jgi:nucleoside-diphosphate-sugar epimerase
MRVVIVGATGNVGTSLVAALAGDERVVEIVGLARRVPDWQLPKTSFRAVDVQTDELSSHFQGADAVVHLAWLFQPSHRPLVTWRANVLGSIRVFDAAVAARVPALVYASSVGAYSPGPADGTAVDESWPTHSRPTAAYGREKAYVERFLDAFELAHPAMRVVRLRPAFIFKRSAATEQRRLFAGPFFPRRLLRPGRLPVLPFPTGLRFQALHSSDAADAFLKALTTDVRGAFNVAADPVLGGERLAAVLDARGVALPRRLVRAAVSGAWHAHLVPAHPELLELFLDLPVMDTTRARSQLGWAPTRTADDAVAEMLIGLADGAGGPTAPLLADRLDRRLVEVGKAIGETT